MQPFTPFFAFAKSVRSTTILSTLVVVAVTACLPYQAYLYMVPDQKDIKRFKFAEVKHADSCFEFQKLPANKPIYVANWTYKHPLVQLPLEQFLEQQKANYFLVIKNDTVVFEYRNKKLEENKPALSFSVAKTFVSACLGIAIQEGKVGSVNDLAKTYLPELNYHENFNTLTINHLLNQSSGIKMEVDNISDGYYGKVEKVLHGIHFKAKPGEHLEYININTILVGIILERVTGKNLHEYFAEKIWTKIGACHTTMWGYDYKTHHTRSFSSFAATVDDYAKFGRLYLNKGKWGNEQVIDSNWVNSSIAPTNGLGQTVGYNNYWFLGEKEIGDYMAVGMYRQQIYINPKEKVIIVSLMQFNHTNLPLRWWQLLRQIAGQG